MMEDKGFAIPQPNDCVAVNTVIYVDGVGCSIRVASVPGYDPDDFLAFIKEQLDEPCGHWDEWAAALWLFVAIYPGDARKGRYVYQVATVDPHQVLRLALNPTMIAHEARSSAQNGDVAPLLPLDADTFEPDLSITDLILWSGNLPTPGGGFTTPPADERPVYKKDALFPVDFPATDDEWLTIFNNDNSESEQN